jgi:hypothetical protein
LLVVSFDWEWDVMVKFAMVKGRSKNSKFQMGKKFKFQGKIFRVGQFGIGKVGKDF